MSRSSVIALILCAVMLPLFIWSRGVTIKHPVPDVETIAAYPKPEYAKIMFLGYNAFAADLLLTKAQYYYGSHYVTDRTYGLLERMIEVIMALNPTLKFMVGFGDAAITSMGTPQAIESANRLLDLGHRLFPEDYEFVFSKGYNYYFYMKDFEKAYPLMYEGARMKGAPAKFYWLVTQVATKGGGYRLGLEYTRNMAEKEKDPKMKEYLSERLKLFSDLVMLSDAAERYYEKTGKYPDKDLNDLVKAGFIPILPKEPYGGQYYFDSDKKTVETDSELYKKPENKDKKSSTTEK